MKEFFTHWNPNFASISLVDSANRIIEDYQAQGYVLTLRQLYYQFVSKDMIENTEKSYKNLGNIITKARTAGLISWNAIEDRNRGVKTHYIQESDDNLVDRLAGLIRFDQWERQETYIEVWVEKEALGNVVARACDPLQINYLSCKGYLSASEAWRSGKRFQEAIDNGKNGVLIHLGDHDPSGIDMTRDNKERVDLFSRYANHVDVNRIALNIDQIKKYSPPPNPTKITDSRAKGYIAQHGKTSWELDALEPSVIEKLIVDTVKPFIDYDIWNEVLEEQTEVRRVLNGLSEKWDSVKSHLQDGFFDDK
jgi:hypothetical protein